MIREQTSIRAASNKVASFIQNFVATTHPEKKEEILELFDNMHTLFPHWVISICNMLHPDIRYVSRNGPHVLGYDMEHLLANSSLKEHFAHVHEADQKDLYDCAYFMHDHLGTVPPEEQHKYRTILHYRFCKADGQYIYLHDERAVLNLRGSGNLYYSLFRDITAEKTFTGVKAELFRQDQNLKKIKEYKPNAQQNPLSKREEEIVSLIRLGLSTKEIAWRLNISPNTARNIKSKLFEKFNVSSSIELLNMTL
jgi:DNA-binding CsgD family transcriptional regulator